MPQCGLFFISVFFYEQHITRPILFWYKIKSDWLDASGSWSDHIQYSSTFSVITLSRFTAFTACNSHQPTTKFQIVSVNSQSASLTTHAKLHTKGLYSGNHLFILNLVQYLFIKTNCRQWSIKHKDINNNSVFRSFYKTKEHTNKARMPTQATFTRFPICATPKILY